MIVSHLKGRLGNQMFQYAIGRSLAEQVGAELFLDSSWIEQHPGGRYELEAFGLGAEVVHVRKIARLRAWTRGRRLLQRLRPSPRPYLRVIEEASDFSFEPRVLEAGDRTYLTGYWQREDYFARHEEQIRHDFAFPEISAESAALATLIKQAPAVAVHVRRGDYAGGAAGRQMGTLERDYYHRAVGRIAAEVGAIQLFLFSDDFAWCTANLEFVHPTVPVERELGPERAYEDMQLMSLCRHHVIANSSFSWWAAWLNPSPQKLVVAPRKWFRDSRLNAQYVLPAAWVRL